MSLRFFVCLCVLSASVSAWSFDEWAANELLPRTRDLVRRHMVGARMFLTEPKTEGGEVVDESSKVNEKEKETNSSSSSSSSEEKKVVHKKEESVAVTTQQPTSSSPASSASPSPSPTSSSPAPTTTVSSVEKKTSEEEMAGKIVDVVEVLRKIADKKEGKKSVAEVKLEKKLEKLPLVKETKTEGGVTVERVRKINSSPSPATGTPAAPKTTPVAQYRRVSCDMCLKAFNGLNYNVVQMKKVAEDMVTKDCEALLNGDEEAIGACIEVMLRKIDEYYNKFEPMIQTNKACVRLGMCAAHLVSNRVPQ